MMKLILAAVLVLASVDQSWAKKECSVKSGKRLITFGGTPELVKFPCKYNAIRETICGKWKLTVTPGNQLENNRNKLYVIRSMWYLYGLLTSPYSKKGGELDIKDVFKFDDSNKAQVTLTEKTGDFEISFGLYEPFGRWHKASKFSIQCFADKFEPSPYPTQLCGNTTRREVKRFKQAHRWKDNRQATLFYNIFTDHRIIQTDTHCLAAQNAMTNRCVKNGVDLRYKAAKLCWPLLAKSKHQYCISRNMDSPIRTFRHCVEYVCSDYTDNQACIELGKEIDLCPKVHEVSQMVKDNCKPDLHSE